MSVIRRKHTKNFTTIGNALFNDERLAADEVGILAYLLSQAPDWEIRRPQLRKRWRIGRDGMKRIMDNWLRTGWLHAEKTRLSNGQFTIIYEVRDEPGPSLSDEEVTAALSMVSIEVGDDNSPESDVPETGPPPTPQPYLDGRLADTRDWEESQNIDSINTNPTKAPVWTSIRNTWPASEILSPVVCEKLFASLSQKDRQQAFEGIKPYLAQCKERSRKICDLSTYLRERRFETVKAPNGYICAILQPGTPQAMRWCEYWVATNGGKFERDRLAHGHAVTVRSEWPPALPPKQSTGPPLSNYMTPEDHDHI